MSISQLNCFPRDSTKSNWRLARNFRLRVAARYASVPYSELHIDQSSDDEMLCRLIEWRTWGKPQQILYLKILASKNTTLEHLIIYFCSII